MTMKYNIQKNISQVSKMNELELRDKLIAFPEAILNTLAKYKKETGVSASNYIRNAVIRKMIVDKLIWFEMRIVVVEKENNGKKLQLSNMEANQLNSFCDGDSCEFKPPLAGNC